MAHTREWESDTRRVDDDEEVKGEGEEEREGVV